MASTDYNDYVSILDSELSALEGTYSQDQVTGAGGSNPLLGTYSNRIFGAPYQLLDSVDKRFPSINSNVGSEYIRHFLLHSPVLHIKPGMPKYTGGDDPTSILRGIKDAYGAHSSGGSAASSIITSLAGGTILSGGSKLQKRMFGFKETYLEYMHYVNYMCHSVARLIGLDDDPNLPNFTFVGYDGGSRPHYFDDIKWENYRMNNRYVNTARDQLNDIWDAATDVFGAVAGTIGQLINRFTNRDEDNNWDIFSSNVEAIWENTNTIYEVMSNKVTSFQIIVEPVSFSESLANNTAESMIESALDGITNQIGSEMAFITNSGAGDGILGDLSQFLGGGIESISQSLGTMVEPVTGGFMNNLFQGAIQSISGQKMIYPEIYKSSKSTMDYEFSVTLTTPYGDKYNYYMNIVVPLCHLIALTAPRMVTSNTVSSPFLVQAFIPGMCTCQLGIIQQMTITKNPNYKHVSVDGFPLTVKVTFTIKELYNALSISPEHDPASFMFNETLNDYLANLAGLIPSMDSYHQQRGNIFENLSNYFTNGMIGEEIANPIVEGIENFFTPHF